MAGRRLPPLPTVKVKITLELCNYFVGMRDCMNYTEQDILRIYRINAVKNLSQNFIMDPRLLDKYTTVLYLAPVLCCGQVCPGGGGPGGSHRGGGEGGFC